MKFRRDKHPDAPVHPEIGVAMPERPNIDTLASLPVFREPVSRKQFLKLGGAGLGGMLLLGTAGCGVLNSEGAGAQSMSVAYSRPIEDLDPHGVSSAAEPTQLVGRNVYDTLVTREDDEIHPSLATEWKRPDEKTWVFTLRSGVKFHDGKPLTATDAKASLERLAGTEEAPLAPLWESLDSVDATDKRTLTIKTKEPLGTMLPNLTLLFILPADKLGDKGFFRKPVGSGPFKVESFVPAQRLKLTSNADYWEGPPKLKELEFSYIPEDSTRLTSLQNGEVQATWTITADQLPQFEGDEDVRLETATSYTYYFNWFNCSREPFTDPNVRRAMWHAVDVDAMAKDLFQDTVRLMKAPISSSVFGYAPQQPYEYDPERARKLLADAGYPDGFSTTLMFSEAYGAEMRRVAETLVSYWADIGVKVEPQELEDAQWLERLTALDWDMDVQTNATQTGDADYSLGRLYTTEANRLGYSNKELDRILYAARTTNDQDERADLYAQACNIIWDDACGIYPFEVQAKYALSSGVNGFEPAPTFTPTFRTVSVEA
jgi:peptide/nickel transport system substrate-binding protein